MVAALLNGELKDVVYVNDPVFKLSIPQSCPGVPAEVLNPRLTWPNPTAYDEQAHKLAAMFTANFEQFAESVTPEILQAGPVQ
jgi:phosphoenolpyruvate carboxykinase (ATP)